MAEKQPQKKKSKSTKTYKAYKVSGGKLERINKMCPKCGKGVFLAKHKDRWYCGKCYYMEKM